MDSWNRSLRLCVIARHLKGHMSHFDDHLPSCIRFQSLFLCQSMVAQSRKCLLSTMLTSARVVGISPQR